VQAEHDAVEVDAHRAAVEREVEVAVDAAAAADAGVEVDEVEAAAGLHREHDRRVVGLQVRDVARDRVPADLGGDRARARLVDVGGDDRRAFLPARARGRWRARGRRRRP
jgi:hypothetical protein